MCQSNPENMEIRQMKPRREKALTPARQMTNGKSRVPVKLLFRAFLFKVTFPFLMSEFSRCSLILRKHDRKNIYSFQESKMWSRAGRGRFSSWQGLHVDPSFSSLDMGKIIIQTL